MRRALFVVLGLAASLAMYLTTASAQPAAKDDLSGLVAEEADFINKTLGKGKIDKKAQRKMRLSALMIAQYAQSGIAKDNARNAMLATLRDQALAVHKAVEDGKYDDAQKLAAKLSTGIAPNANAKLQGPDLIKIEEFENIMSQFSSVRLGGFGMEDYLDSLTELKADLNDADARKAYLFARKLSAIATLIDPHTPPMLGGAKNLAAWKGFAKNMNDDTLKLAKAAEGKNAAAITKAAVKVADSCKSCHDVFR